jgi:Leucine-rich repeat (LRR) protein
MLNVSFRGKKYPIIENSLNLSSIGIQDITEIQGLSELTDLENLDLSNNSIRVVSGISELTNLKVLDLNNNKVSKILNFCAVNFEF